MNQAIIDPTVTCTGPRCPGGSATTAAAGEASVDSSDGRGAIYNDDYGDYDSGNTTITGPTFSKCQAAMERWRWAKCNPCLALM